LGEAIPGVHLTIKHGLLIPSAGIDESNAQGDYYILFPRKPFESAQRLHSALRHKLGIKKFGVLITDSHITPLRRGVTGVALAYWGFEPLQNFIRSADLYGVPLKMTKVNRADALAAAAVLLMGEAAESCPIAIVENSELTFCTKNNAKQLQMPRDQDLFRKFFS